ncbi:hypothetical protein [Chitinilyticum piscinae]|uniref:Uncharacterized protein n=1 Tax=Chitinilyticum piscinae TaxID=2866724 RepID=A0A8J7FJN6_9NEIS|nr:hypothetical protein [Chitinilyticum piscinae]MBE9610600.1 hypothetical protein [Chitinilyticum piscinae]
MSSASFVLFSLGIAGLIVISQFLHARHDKTDIRIMAVFTAVCLGAAALLSLPALETHAAG